MQSDNNSVILKFQNLIQSSKILKSEYRLINEIKKSKFYFPSYQFIVHQYVQEYMDRNNILKTKSITNSVQMFPLRDIFQCLFSDSKFISEALDYRTILFQSESSDIFNYIQSSHWQSILLKLNLPENV